MHTKGFGFVDWHMVMMAHRRRRSVALAEADASVHEDETAEAARRRLRNRLSQRQFRERKSLYIKQLEERTRGSTESESIRNKKLADENAAMHEVILNARSQAFRLSSSLYSLGVELGKVLNIPAPEGPELITGARDRSGSPGETSNTQGTLSSSRKGSSGDGAEIDANNGGSSGLAPCNNIEPVTDSHGLSHGSSSIVPESIPAQQSTDNFPLSSNITGNGAFVDDLVGGIFPNLTEMDDFGTRANQFDLSSYHDLASVLPLQARRDDFSNFDTRIHQSEQTGFGSNDVAGFRAWNMIQGSPITNTSVPRSPSGTDLFAPKGLYPSGLSNMNKSPLNPSACSFSLHIETLEAQARCLLQSAIDGSSRKMLYRSCSAIMSLFVQNAWPDTFSLWFKSQVPDIIGRILLWRIHPTTDNYHNLPSDYHPSELQLSVPHSAVIDWVPYQALRDRIILLYNNSAAIDRLLCDMVDYYVIEVEDLSSILSEAPPGRAYFGVWNIFTAIDTVASDKDDNVKSASNVKHPNDPSHHLGSDAENPVHSRTVGNFATTNITTHGMQQPLGLSPPKPYHPEDILKDPSSVLKVSQSIRLYAAHLWRFDPALFEKYPELKFDGYENVVAKGRSCRVSAAPPQGPKAMSESTMNLYKAALQGLM